MNVRSTFPSSSNASAVTFQGMVRRHSDAAGVSAIISATRAAAAAPLSAAPSILGDTQKSPHPTTLLSASARHPIPDAAAAATVAVVWKRRAPAMRGDVRDFDIRRVDASFASALRGLRGESQQRVGHLLRHLVQKGSRRFQKGGRGLDAPRRVRRRALHHPARHVGVGRARPPPRLGRVVGDPGHHVVPLDRRALELEQPRFPRSSSRRLRRRPAPLFRPFFTASISAKLGVWPEARMPFQTAGESSERSGGSSPYTRTLRSLAACLSAATTATKRASRRGGSAGTGSVLAPGSSVVRSARKSGAPRSTSRPRHRVRPRTT